MSYLKRNNDGLNDILWDTVKYKVLVTIDGFPQEGQVTTLLDSYNNYDTIIFVYANGSSGATKTYQHFIKLYPSNFMLHYPFTTYMGSYGSFINSNTISWKYSGYTNPVYVRTIYGFNF